MHFFSTVAMDFAIYRGHCPLHLFSRGILDRLACVVHPDLIVNAGEVAFDFVIARSPLCNFKRVPRRPIVWVPIGAG